MPRSIRKPKPLVAKNPVPRIEIVQKPFGYGVTKAFYAVGNQSFEEESQAKAHLRKLRGLPPLAEKGTSAAFTAKPGTVWALVVRSPYAQQIASGKKRIEYRVRRARYRGWLAIVAARRPESGDDAGRVVCLVKLVDCTGREGDYEWHLTSAIPLKQRWEVPGRLGLFDVTARVPPSVRKLLKGRD